MNHTSHQISESPGNGSCSFDEDLQLLLESPSARAASANFFSSHFGTLDPNTLNGAYDLYRSGSLGSLDVTRHLNTAGFFDSNHQPLSPQAGQQQQQQQQAAGALQPEMVLRQASEQQPENCTGSVTSATAVLSQQGQQQARQPVGIGDPVFTLPAGTGIAAVAPVAPVQQPAAVVQHLEPYFKHTGPAFDTNNQPAESPVLRPLQIRTSARKSPASRRVHSPPAGTGHYHHQQQQPETPEQQPPPQQQQKHQLYSPATSAQGLGASKQPADDVWGNGAPHQWSAAAHTAGGADKAAAVKAPAAVVTPSAPAVACQVGTLVWAKFPRFPWWPAVVIAPTADVSPPSTSNSSSSNASVLVRFLGTHDASWVDPDKSISAWGTNQHERSSKTKAAAFLAALREANAYANTGVVPEAFSTPPQLSVAHAPAATTKAKGSKGKQAKPPAVATAATTAQHAAPTTPTSPAAATAAAVQQEPHLGDADVWLYVAAPAAAEDTPPAPAGLLVPASAMGGTGGPAVSDMAPGLPAAAAGTGSSSSKPHRGHRGTAVGSKVPAGPAAGLRSSEKRKASRPQRARGSKRSRVEY